MAAFIIAYAALSSPPVWSRRKVVEVRYYSGKRRMDMETGCGPIVALHTTDCRIAQSLPAEMVRERHLERQGMIAASAGPRAAVGVAAIIIALATYQFSRHAARLHGAPRASHPAPLPSDSAT